MKRTYYVVVAILLTGSAALSTGTLHAADEGQHTSSHEKALKDKDRNVDKAYKKTLKEIEKREKEEAKAREKDAEKRRKKYEKLKKEMKKLKAQLKEREESYDGGQPVTAERWKHADGSPVRIELGTCEDKPGPPKSKQRSEIRVGTSGTATPDGVGAAGGIGEGGTAIRVGGGGHSPSSAGDDE